jgi:glycosyltransferase involved in cell wall biosynthesis
MEESGARSDVFVSLRRPDAFQQLLRAKRKYLWLHDTDYGMVPLSLMYAPNRIFVLSEAHKAIIKSSHQIDDDSIFWVTRNGINPLALEYADKEAKKRDPYRVVYASSYDRGLDHLLKMWEKIKKEVPQAHLHIYYGWNTYDQLMEARRGTPHGEMMMKQKEYLMELIRNADGVTDEGRVSQNQQYKDFAESGVWLYPTEFYEISCITAMFSQALGCVPVCTPHAALVETVGDYGMKVPLSDICDATIEVLKDQKGTEKRRKPMMEWARQEYNMKDLAKSWDKFLEEEI